MSLTGRRTVVLLTLAGAGLVLLAGSRTWATVSLAQTLPGLSDVDLTGRQSLPSALPIALAAAAGAVVLATSGRVVRILVAAGLVIAGAFLAVAGVQGARNASAAFGTAFRDSLNVVRADSMAGGITDTSEAVNFSFWPWVAAAGGAVLLLAGLLALVGGRHWSGPTRRYERAPAGGPDPSTTGSGPAPAGRAKPDPADTPAGTWDALSRGEDPTSPPDAAT